MVNRPVSSVRHPLRYARNPVTAACGVGAAALLVAGVLVAGSAAAGAATGTDSVTAHGRVGVGHGVTGFQIDVHASKTADGAVSGYFSGKAELTGAGLTLPTPVSFAGPVKCLTVHGDTATFGYPLTVVTPTVLSPILNQTSIVITVKVGTGNRPAQVGFLGPIPTPLAEGCPAQPPVFTLQGNAAVNDG